MISVLSQPGDIALSGNPMVVKIRCTDGGGDPIVWYGVRSELVTTGYFRLTAGQVLTVNLTEPSGVSVTQTFTANGTPSGSESLIPDNTVSGYASDLAYWEAVAAKIEAHRNINPALQVTATDTGSGIKLILAARDYDADYQVAWSTAVGSITITDFETPANTGPDEYEVLIDVMMEETLNSGEYTRVGQLRARPGSDSNVQFDLSSVLDPAIRNTLTDPLVPSWSATSQQNANTLRNYYIRIAETNADDDSSFQQISTQSARKVMLGGIAQNVFASTDFLGGIDEDSSFFTWRPDKRRLDRTQPEWLPWYNYTGSTVFVRLYVRTTDSDGVTATLTFFQTSISAYRTILFPVSPRQLGLNSNVVKYTVRVIDDATYVATLGGTITRWSPVRTYYIDDAPYEEVRYLQYLNSFHFPETLRCTGILTKELQVTPTDSERILQPGFADSIAQRFTHRSDWENRFTYHSGFLSAPDIDALQELLIYRRAYEVSSSGYIPLLLLSKSFPIAATRENLRSIALEAAPAQRDAYYYWDEPAAEDPVTAEYPGPYENDTEAASNGVPLGHLYRLATVNSYDAITAGSRILWVRTDDMVIGTYPGAYANDSAAATAGVALGEIYIIDAEIPTAGDRLIVVRTDGGAVGTFPGPYASDSAAASGGVAVGEAYLLAAINDYDFPNPGARPLAVRLA